MKKLLSLFIILFSFFFSFAQTSFPTYQPVGNSVTLWDQKGAVRGTKGLINGSYTDTTAANSTGNYIKFYPGAQIQTADDAIWVRNHNATAWIQNTSTTNVTINNIFNNSITNTTIINQTDSSVIIQICTGAGSCDTLTLVTNITNVTYSTTTFINDTTIQVCGLDTLTSIIECDTITIPQQVLYVFQKGLNETVAGIVNFGSDITNPISLLTNDAALIGTLGDTIAIFHPDGSVSFPHYNYLHNDGVISKFAGFDANGNLLAGSLPTQDSCGIFNGLNVTWDSARVFDVSPGRWASCCDLITRTLSTTDTVQLDPNDATNPRFDAIIVTQTGVDKVTGTASSNPAFPDIPDCAIVLAYVLMNAGDDGPADVCQSIIYDTTGGSEWDTVKTISSVNFSNTTNVAHAPYSVSAGAWTNNQYIQFNSPSFTPITVSNYTAFKFYLKKKATFAANVQIRITWYNGSTPVSVARNIATAAYGYVRTNTNYEIYTIPMPDFGFTGTQATGVRFTFTNTNASGFYLDWVQLQGCLTPPPATGGIQQWLGTGNTLFDIVEAFPNGPNETITTPLNNAAAYKVWGNNTNVSATPAYITFDYSTMGTGLLPVTNIAPSNIDGYMLATIAGVSTWISVAPGYDTTIVVGPNLYVRNGTVRDTLRFYVPGIDSVLASPVFGSTITANRSITWGNFTFTNTFNSIVANGLNITSTSTAAGAPGQRLLNVALSGANANANQLTIAGNFSNTHTGTSSTNYGLQGAASGGTINIGVVGSGNSIGVYGLNAAGTFGVALQGSAFGSNSTAVLAENGSTATTSIGVNSTVQDGLPLQLSSNPITTNDVVAAIVSYRFSSGGAGGDGIGQSFQFANYTSASTSQLSNELISKWTTANNATRTSQFSITGVLSASTVTLFTLNGNGSMQLLPITATAASAITPAEGMMLFASSTDATFTSIGFWGYENGAWHKF